MLEAKIVLLDKYDQRIENNGDIDAVSERIEKPKLKTDDNEQCHRRLCLRINGVELSEGRNGDSGKEWECFEKMIVS